MVTTYYGTYFIPSFTGTGGSNAPPGGYTTLATTGCFDLVLTQSSGGTSGKMRLHSTTGADTPPNCMSPSVGDGTYTNIGLSGNVSGSTYTEDPNGLDAFGDLANVWAVENWFHTTTTTRSRAMGHHGSAKTMTASADNASGYGVPNDTDGTVFFYDDGPITGMTITNLTRTSGSGSFTLGASSEAAGGGGVTGTITVLGSTTSSSAVRMPALSKRE